MSDYRNPAAMDPPLPECRVMMTIPARPSSASPMRQPNLKAIGEDPQRDGLLKPLPRGAHTRADRRLPYR